MLKALHLPQRFAWEELLRAVEKKRQRPLETMECSLPPEFSALWVETEQVDYLIVATGLTALQYRQAMAHELAHMILEHQPGASTSPLSLREALGIPAEMWALARSAYRYGDQEEIEAEWLATAICLQLLEPETTLPPSEDAALDRFHSRIA
ncbi:MAG: ImmA/IrrE family metallo-endopeptidase [Chloroflexia bacterium]|nr:ImmA/IrrE family metallo-endopeptidase [Chloroflexia bacterium]